MHPESVKGVEEYAAAREAVTKEGVEQVAKRYFGSDNWYLVAAGEVDEERLTVNL